MKKQFIGIGVILMFFIVLLTGCEQQDVPKNGDTRFIDTKFLGGEYNASIFHKQIYLNGNWSDLPEINYTKNGVRYDGAYVPTLKESMNWIKANTNENCTVLCWWDYGSMIEGYAERNVIARFASLALKDKIAMFGMLDEEGKKKFIEENEWTSNETIQELAMVLTTSNISSDDSSTIIQKYNISYIFTRGYDKDCAWIFLNAAGKNANEYFIDNKPNEMCNETLIYKMWEENPQIYGLQLCYYNNASDRFSDVRIFKII
jgi:hypothetical protein